jgi:hypothetical protein
LIFDFVAYRDAPETILLPKASPLRGDAALRQRNFCGNAALCATSAVTPFLLCGNANLMAHEVVAPEFSFIPEMR